MAVTIDPATAEWLDGPGFVAWLGENADLEGISLGDEVLYRNIVRWRSGSAASIWKADEVCIRFGLMLYEIPGELYRDSPKKHTDYRRFDDDVKRRAARMARATSTAQAARTFGASPRSVRIWMNAFA